MVYISQSGPNYYGGLNLQEFTVPIHGIWVIKILISFLNYVFGCIEFI